MKRPVFVAIALTLGAMAAFMAARLMDSGASSGVSVVVVSSPIEAGKAIGASQIEAIRWPSSSIPADAIASADKVVGRIARVAMIAGEPVLPGKLAPNGASGGLSSIIPEGKRAITVKVDEVIAVAGFALPGSYVDVMVSGKDADKQVFSRIVLSHVKVLAVAQQTSAEHDKPKVVNAVTLELTPHESEKLDLARTIGKLSLVLRNELDESETNSVGARLVDLVHGDSSSESDDALDADQGAGVSLSRPYQRLGLEEIRGTSRN